MVNVLFLMSYFPAQDRGAENAMNIINLFAYNSNIFSNSGKMLRRSHVMSRMNGALE